MNSVQHLQRIFLFLAGCTVFLFACKDVSEEPIRADKEFFVGQWWLDSSSNPLNGRDKLFILSTGDIYLFSGSDGGSCRKFRTYTLDTIETEYNEKLFVRVLDSNRISVSGQYSKWENFFARRGTTEDLQEYIDGDSLRNKLIGFWQSHQLPFPFEMMNYGVASSAFTLQIRNDGKLVFYPDHNLDSGFIYSYHMKQDGFWFSHLCVSSDAKVQSLNSDSMRLYLNPHIDTVTLYRRHYLE